MEILRGLHLTTTTIEKVMKSTQISAPFGLSLPRLPKFIRQDPRHFQILFLSTFLMFGIFGLNWDVDLVKVGFTIGACLGIQAACIFFTDKDWSGLKSAMISALGLCLLLKTGMLSTLFLAAAFTILGKFVIRVKGKHIFNPTLLGILLTLMLTGDAWVSPGQWGNGGMALFIIGSCAFFILMRVGQIDTSIMFLVTYGLLEYLVTCVWMGWPADFWLLRMSNGTLLLFTFFMITDPRTTPNARFARMLFAIAVAGVAVLITTAMELRWLSFELPIWFKIHTAPLWALLIVSPLTLLLDKKFIHQRFKWI